MMRPSCRSCVPGASPRLDVALLLLCCTLRVAAAPIFDVTELPFRANGLKFNNHGLFGGTSLRTSDAGPQAFLYTAATGQVFFPLLGDAESSVDFLNDRGQAILAHFPFESDGTPVHYLYTPGIGTERLRLPGGGLTDFSDTGQIVGYGGTTGSFSYTKEGGAVALPTIGGVRVSARTVNNKGTIAGENYIVDRVRVWFYTPEHGYRLQPDNPQRATLLVSDINDNEELVGEMITDTRRVRGFFRHASGRLHEFEGYPQSGAFAVNQAGEAIGMTFGGFNGVPQYYSKSLGTDVNLNTLLAPGSGWRLTGVSDINDRGEILATGISRRDSRGANLLLTPRTPAIPEPRSSMLLLGGAAVLFGGRRWLTRAASNACSRA